MKIPAGMATMVMPRLLVVSGNFTLPCLQAAEPNIRADSSKKAHTTMGLWSLELDMWDCLITDVDIAAYCCAFHAHYVSYVMHPFKGS